MSKRCPSCGRDAEKGPFCRFCGSPLDEESDGPPEEIDETTEEASTPYIDFGFDLEVLNRSTILSLLVRAEFDLITEELEEVIEQSRATRHALELKEVDTALLLSRAEALRGRLDTLKARRRVLEDTPRSIKLEDLTVQFESATEKLAKLKDAEKTLDKDVYDEQHSLLTSEVKELRSLIRDESKSLQRDVKELERKEREFQKSKSKLDARLKIGDISKSSYAKATGVLLRQIRLVSEARKRLDEILSTTKEKTA